jgi:hypothetical protein
MKQHLAKAFSRLAEHHLKKAKHAEEDGDGEMAQDHAETGQACAECAKVLTASMKAAGLSARELEPLPTGLRVFSPGVPATAIPRFGAAPMVAKSAVAAEFQKLIAVADDEE